MHYLRRVILEQNAMQYHISVFSDVYLSKLQAQCSVCVLQHSFFREEVPFISPLVSSKLLLRAVRLNDKTLLQKLANDLKKIPYVSQSEKFDNFYTIPQ